MTGLWYLVYAVIGAAGFYLGTVSPFIFICVWSLIALLLGTAGNDFRPQKPSPALVSAVVFTAANIAGWLFTRLF